jgi:glycosyltransferase involved in cell wall biosynthesis
MTDPLGQSQVIPYLQGLVKAGHSVWLLSCEKPARFEKEKITIAKLLSESSIEWLPIKYTSSPPVFSTLWDVNALKKAASECIEANEIDVLHCRSYISALVGEYAQKKYGTKWIFDMRGFWADERVDGGIWKLSNPLFKTIYNFFKRKEKDYLKKADAVISLTQNAKDEILSWKGFEKTPITVIPCCADLSLFKMRSQQDETVISLRNELKIPDDSFVLSYLGSLGTWYMLDEMLDFFIVLKQKFPNAIFLFITGDSEEMVFAKSRSKGINDNSIRIRSAKRAEVPTYASISDASMFFIKPLFSKKASSPTKMGELMSLGIPLICNSGVGDVASILNDGGNGILIHEFNTSEYQKAVNELPHILENLADSTIACAERYYSLKDGIQKYNGVYESITRDGKDAD